MYLVLFIFIIRTAEIPTISSIDTKHAIATPTPMAILLDLPFNSGGAVGDAIWSILSLVNIKSSFMASDATPLSCIENSKYYRWNKK